MTVSEDTSYVYTEDESRSSDKINSTVANQIKEETPNENYHETKLNLNETLLENYDIMIKIEIDDSDVSEKIDVSINYHFLINEVVDDFINEVVKDDSHERKISESRLPQGNETLSQYSSSESFKKTDLDSIEDLIENDEISKKQEIVDCLQLLCNGVYDRLMYMCVPVDKEYTVCILKQLVDYLEAIVVDTVSTAEMCIQYLQDNLLEPEVFLPLDFIQDASFQDSLKEITYQEGVELLYNMLEFEPPEIKKAILLATENCLICKTDNDAMKFSYDMKEDERSNAVTLDGTLYHKSGIIYGGEINVESYVPWWDPNYVAPKLEKEIKTDLTEGIENESFAEEVANEIVMSCIDDLIHKEIENKGDSKHTHEHETIETEKRENSQHSLSKETECRINNDNAQEILTSGNSTKRKEATKAMCDICGVVMNKKSLPKHLKLQHYNSKKVKSPNIFSCATCEFTCKKKAYLNKHLKYCGIPDNQRKQYPCLCCQKLYLSENKLKTHKCLGINGMRKPWNNVQYSCVHCVKKFTEETNLIRHLKVHEESRKSFSCESCTFTCDRPDSLHRHKSKASNCLRYKLILCEICNKNFKGTGRFENHFRNTSCKKVKAKTFSCKFCKVNFNSKQKKQAHQFKKVCQKKKRKKINLSEKMQICEESKIKGDKEVAKKWGIRSDHVQQYLKNEEKMKEVSSDQIKKRKILLGSGRKQSEDVVYAGVKVAETGDNFDKIGVPFPLNAAKMLIEESMQKFSEGKVKPIRDEKGTIINYNSEPSEGEQKDDSLLNRNKTKTISKSQFKVLKKKIKFKNQSVVGPRMAKKEVLQVRSMHTRKSWMKAKPTRPPFTDGNVDEFSMNYTAPSKSFSRIVYEKRHSKSKKERIKPKTALAPIAHRSTLSHSVYLSSLPVLKPQWLDKIQMNYIKFLQDQAAQQKIKDEAEVEVEAVTWEPKMESIESVCGNRKRKTYDNVKSTSAKRKMVEKNFQNIEEDEEIIDLADQIIRNKNYDQLNHLTEEQYMKIKLFLLSSKCLELYPEHQSGEIENTLNSVDNLRPWLPKLEINSLPSESSKQEGSSVCSSMDMSIDLEKELNFETPVELNENSKVKFPEKHEVDIVPDATTHIATGKWHMQMMDISNAAHSFSLAHKQLSNLNDETASKCAECCFDCGKALFETSCPDFYEKKDEVKEKTENEKNEITNSLHLAWEMLECAKGIFTRKYVEAMENGISLLEYTSKLSETYRILAKVSLKCEYYTQCKEYLFACFEKRLENLPPDCYNLVDTHYKHAVKVRFHSSIEVAVEAFNKAAEVLVRVEKSVRREEKIEENTTETDERPFGNLNNREEKSILDEDIGDYGYTQEYEYGDTYEFQNLPSFDENYPDIVPVLPLGYQRPSKKVLDILLKYGYISKLDHFRVVHGYILLGMGLNAGKESVELNRKYDNVYITSMAKETQLKAGRWNDTVTFGALVCAIQYDWNLFINRFAMDYAGCHTGPQTEVLVKDVLGATPVEIGKGCTFKQQPVDDIMNHIRSVMELVRDRKYIEKIENGDVTPTGQPTGYSWDDYALFVEQAVDIFNQDPEKRRSALRSWEHCGISPDNRHIEDLNANTSLMDAFKEYGSILTRPDPTDALQTPNGIKKIGQTPVACFFCQKELSLVTNTMTQIHLGLSGSKPICPKSIYLSTKSFDKIFEIQQRDHVNMREKYNQLHKYFQENKESMYQSNITQISLPEHYFKLTNTGNFITEKSNIDQTCRAETCDINNITRKKDLLDLADDHGILGLKTKKISVIKEKIIYHYREVHKISFEPNYDANF